MSLLKSHSYPFGSRVRTTTRNIEDEDFKSSGSDFETAPPPFDSNHSRSRSDAQTKLADRPKGLHDRSKSEPSKKPPPFIATIRIEAPVLTEDDTNDRIPEDQSEESSVTCSPLPLISFDSSDGPRLRGATRVVPERDDTESGDLTDVPSPPSDLSL